jgi:hypothetical protein
LNYTSLIRARIRVYIKSKDYWVKACKDFPRDRNSDLLERTLKVHGPDIKFEELPLAYCKIFDYMSSLVPEPVIEHFQASRKFRVLMDKDYAKVKEQRRLRRKGK